MANLKIDSSGLTIDTLESVCHIRLLSFSQQLDVNIINISSVSG